MWTKESANLSRNKTKQNKTKAFSWWKEKGKYLFKRNGEESRVEKEKMCKTKKNLPLYDHLTSYPIVFVSSHGNTIDSFSMDSTIRTELFESIRVSPLIMADLRDSISEEIQKWEQNGEKKGINEYILEWK